MASLSTDPHDGTDNEAFENDAVIELGDDSPDTPGDIHVNPTSATGAERLTPDTPVVAGAGSDDTDANHDTGDVMTMSAMGGKGDGGAGNDANGNSRDTSVDAMLSGLEEQLNNNESSTTDDAGRVSDLNDWKDRSQVAATSTLSIIQVGLLKDILDGGTDRYSYYKTGLSLVIICLLLEIISAFLIVSLYIIKSKLSKSSPVTKNPSDKMRAPGDAGNGEAVSCDITLDSLLTSVSFVKNGSAQLEQQLSSAYRLCYAEELLNTLKLAQGHSRLCVKRDMTAGPINDISEADADVTENGAAHTDPTSVEFESLSNTVQSMQTARKREEILLKAIQMIRKQNTYDTLLYIQAALTYIFLALTFINIFLITFAVPKPENENANNDASISYEQVN